MAVEVILPVLGETMDEGTILRWLVDVGQHVDRGDPLYEVETDKAVLEVEAPSTGVLRSILQPAGSRVPVLSVVGVIAAAEEDVSGYEPQVVQETSQAGTGAAVTASQLGVVEAERIMASPRARRLASDRGVNLAQVKGSGPGGRIVERDVEEYLAAEPVATPTARKMASQRGIDLAAISRNGSTSGRVTKAEVEAVLASLSRGAAAALPTPVERVPMSGIRAVIAERMSVSAHTAAQVTLTTEADGTELVRLRTVLNERLGASEGAKVAYTDILVAIVARALREFPYVNARLQGEHIEYLPSVNVGVAVDSEHGLLVPVVRDADRKTVADIASELRTLTERARSRKSLPDDLTGGTFTITNLGMYGIDAFTPIINPPECAILGVGRLREVPAVRDGSLCVRPGIVLSLTFDHRLVDGAPAARFLQRVARLTEAPYLLLA